MVRKFAVLAAAFLAVALVLVAVKRRQARPQSPRYVFFICVDAVRQAG
jgi:HAMP domain-containing protein